MPSPRIRKLPIVALVGRANVGKSTLWNRLTETGNAMVSAIPNTTRDRNYGRVIWRGMAVEVVDTGGMDADQGDEIGRGILTQAKLAIKDADVVLFMVDSHVGVTALDTDLALRAKKINPHTLLVMNKMDDMRYLSDAFSHEVAALRMGDAISCAAGTGKGVGDLLDRVFDELARLNKPALPIEDKTGLKLVVMGRPNVGKSSIVNAILGEQRVITSPIAHTTREPVDTSFDWQGELVTLVDTAGMRKRSKVERGIEKQGLERNRLALIRADIALLVFDASEDPTQQDKHLAGLLEENTRGLVLVANKWDLVENKTTHTTEEYELRIRRAFPFLKWAPIMFVSAKNGLRTDKLMDLVFQIREERRRQITYNALQRLLKTVVARKKPLADVGAFSPYLHDVSQIGIDPPTFLIGVRGQKASVHQSWIHYFENRLREKFGFMGTPVLVKVQLLPIQTLEERNPESKKKTDASGKKKNPWRRKKPIGRKGNRY